ncbi:hypothetical protein KEM52_000578 [Ascosphaera acerosa]|nr:hypothetical protein KEM52_000578 [Ascosphaera acerosa]
MACAAVLCEKLKGVFQLKEKYRAYQQRRGERAARESQDDARRRRGRHVRRQDGDTSTAAPPRGRRPAIKVPKVKPYKPKYDKDGKVIPELYKPHEMPRSKYRGPVDPAHWDRLMAYSLRLAQRERPRSVLSDCSPMATRFASRRESWASGDDAGGIHGCTIAGPGTGARSECTCNGSPNHARSAYGSGNAAAAKDGHGDEESQVELTRPFSQPALDEFLRDEGAGSLLDATAADGERSRPVSSPTLDTSTRDRSDILGDADLISYSTSATSITAQANPPPQTTSHQPRSSWAQALEQELGNVDAGSPTAKAATAPLASPQQRVDEIDGSNTAAKPCHVPDIVVTRDTALRANPTR